MRIIQLLFFILASILFVTCQSPSNQSGDNKESVEAIDTKENQNQSQTQSKTKNPISKPGSLSQNLSTITQNQFWDNKQIHFRDFTGESSAAVYEAIKGQKYFKNTYIFVYATLEDMEGTSQYDKIADTMDSTRLDDRIFIWVHMKADKEVIFVKKLISDNIKGIIHGGTESL